MFVSNVKKDIILTAIISVNNILKVAKKSMKLGLVLIVKKTMILIKMESVFLLMKAKTITVLNIGGSTQKENGSLNGFQAVKKSVKNVKKGITLTQIINVLNTHLFV